MFLLSRFLPHALCCFHPPQEQDESRPETSHGPPYVVPRRPVPYAMINVPHEPEIMDEHAFRRMLTASPACPLEATPVSNGQRQELMKKRKKKDKQCPQPSGSLNVDFAFNPGSPSPAPDNVKRGYIKKKGSKPRVMKRSSTNTVRGSHSDRPSQHSIDPVQDREAVLLGVSAQSTGLSDILKSRNASDGGYDSDAKVIKTPELNTAANAFTVRYEDVQEALTDAELAPDDSMSNCPSSPLALRLSHETSSKHLNRSFPHPSTPERMSFTEALRLRSIESPGAVLKRLSAGIADGSIKPPTNRELCTPKLPGVPQTTERCKQVAGRDSEEQEPDTPQTVIRRLSNLIQSEREIEEAQNVSRVSIENERTGPLNQLDPALLEYLSRFSERESLDLTLNHEVDRSKTVIDNQTSPARTQVDEQETSNPKESDLAGPCNAEVASVVSVVPSEHNSVHLFNMDISARLASKSNATMLSPSGSKNHSKLSLEPPPPIPIIRNIVPSTSLQSPQSGRAEHNRRPSDPRTRQLFERPDAYSNPYRKGPRKSTDKPRRVSQEQDNASSIYSMDSGVPPNTSEISARRFAVNVKKNVNSLAVGGRSASTDIPIRRSSCAHSAAGSAPQRSLSACESGQKSQLNAASEMINRYLDGKVDADAGGVEPSVPLFRRASGLDNADPDPLSNHDGDGSDPVHGRPHERGDSCSSDVVHLRSRSEQGRLRSGNSDEHAGDAEQRCDATHDYESIIGPSKESATEMWNRVYQEARAENLGRDISSLSNVAFDDLHRSRSYSSPRLLHRSSSILPTPKSASRRSRSVGSEFRRPFREDASVASKSAGRLSRTMKRLSFWQLRSHRAQEDPGPQPYKLQKRSHSCLPKRQSSTIFPTCNATDLRSTHTPPLDHYLGYWGSFPSHSREQRNGPAGELDSVLARNFGAAHPDPARVHAVQGLLSGRGSQSALSAMQSKTMRILSGRSNKLDRNKTRSMPSVHSTHRIRKYQRPLLNLWQYRSRPKRSVWQDYIVQASPQGTVFARRSATYPDLESLPGEGLFTFTGPLRGSSDVSLAVSNSECQSETSGRNVKAAGALARGDEAERGRIHNNVESCTRPEIESNMWGSIKFEKMSQTEQRMKENNGLGGSSSETVRDASTNITADLSVTIPRTSKDLKMPGGYDQD